MNSACRNINNFDYVDYVEIVIDCDNFNMSRSLAEIILNCDSTDILLNLTNVSLVDNSFFNYLIEIHKKSTLKPVQIRLFGLQAEVLTLFFLLKLDKCFDVYSNKNDAINNLKPLVKRRFRIVSSISILIFSFLLNCSLQLSDFI